MTKIVTSRINVCFVSETDVRDPTFTVNFSSPDATSFSGFTIRASDDSVSIARDQDGVGTDFDLPAEHAL